MSAVDFLGLFAADQRQAGSEQDRKEQYLQHVVARQRVERGGRDDVQQEAPDTAALQLVRVVGIGIERFGIQRRWIDVHAVAGSEQIGEHQADHEGYGGHHFEIDQCLDADASDLFQVARTGNAMHDDAEHDRRHDHRNQLQECVAEDLEPDGKVRSGHSKHDPEQQSCQDLHE